MAESLNRNWELKSKIDEGVSKKFSWEPEKLTRGENLIKFETKKKREEREIERERESCLA